ncbi:MAG: endopeptidase La [Paramuribaculum sp.]|nr:endopeptidase La [Paramuribaculum sp.]
MSDNTEKIIPMAQVDIDLSKPIIPPSPDNLLILPTRDLVLFPDITFPVTIGRSTSIRTAEFSEKTGTPIGIICQKDASVETPDIPNDLYPIGVVASVVKIFDIPNGPKTAIVRCGNKFTVIGKGKDTNSISAEFLNPDKNVNSPKLNNIVKQIRISIKHIHDAIKGDNSMDLPFDIDDITLPSMLINMLATHLPFSFKSKIEMLECDDMVERGLMLLHELKENEEYSKITQEINERTKFSLNENQRMHFLQHQMEVIRQEIYGDEDDDISRLRARSEKLSMPDEVKALFERELNKLSRLNPQIPDYAIQYNYLDLLVSLPWGINDELTHGLNEAEDILNADHYGLEKVKERILEQLAVIMNTPDGHAPILCLVGAPGVGKTSLGQSIAKALGKKYQRVSLGGLHDEAELRGHRRTYIGAMPGRIIDAMRRAGSSNPVLLLDEIDKIGYDGKSDPSSALLEVLDPEQNCKFHDNYVDADYDLSNVLFIATANSLATLSQPLLDRMEVIDISGYLLEEKIEIAKRHLIPRAIKANAMTKLGITFTDEAITDIIEGYTSESGVRQLEKKISAVIRKLVLRKMRGMKLYRKIQPKHLQELLGTPVFTKDRYEGNDYAGVVTGLAWTAAGGEILYIESSISKGKGEKLILTGNLGDVMKESAMIALQYIKAHASLWNIDERIFDYYTLHIHVPEGAIPKDGPSAGITMVTSIVSALTQRKVKPRIAMTGEITLRGKVLPVGGIKEKILAAKRAGIDTIIISETNRKDILDIPATYLDGLNFIYVTDIRQVIDAALLSDKVDNYKTFEIPEDKN